MSSGFGSSPDTPSSTVSSAMSPHAPSFYPPGETVESVIGRYEQVGCFACLHLLCEMAFIFTSQLNIRPDSNLCLVATPQPVIG